MQIEQYLSNKRPTTGYYTIVGGNLVTWRSREQVVAKSSAKAEYRAMAQGICEVLWIKTLLKELSFEPKEPMKIYCDNKVTINIAHNPIQHD